MSNNQCCPTNPLSLRERVGVRESNIAKSLFLYIPSSCPSPSGRRDRSLMIFMSMKRLVVVSYKEFIGLHQAPKC